MGEKQKVEGIDNKEIKLFLAIIAVLVLLLVFEMFFFTGRPEVVEEQEKIKQELQEMQSVTVEKEQKTVYKALNDIVSMMNNQDYEGLYKILKDDYRDYYFSEYEEYEDFIKTYAKERYYAKYSSYYRDGNLYYIIVDFLKEKYTREDLLSLRPTKVDTVVLEEQEDGSFKVALNGFAENIYHNKSKTVAGVTFSLINSVRNTETMKTYVLIKNNSDKVVTASTNNIQPEIVGSISSKISPTSVLGLDPGESGVLSIEYYLQYNKKREFDGINITGVKFDDGTIIEDIFLEK